VEITPALDDNIEQEAQENALRVPIYNAPRVDTEWHNLTVTTTLQGTTVGKPRPAPENPDSVEPTEYETFDSFRTKIPQMVGRSVVLEADDSYVYLALDEAYITDEDITITALDGFRFEVTLSVSGYGYRMDKDDYPAQPVNNYNPIATEQNVLPWGIDASGWYVSAFADAATVGERGVFYNNSSYTFPPLPDTFWYKTIGTLPYDSGVDDWLGNAAWSAAFWLVNATDVVSNTLELLRFQGITDPGILAAITFSDSTKTTFSFYVGTDIEITKWVFPVQSRHSFVLVQDSSFNYKLYVDGALLSPTTGTGLGANTDDIIVSQACSGVRCVWDNMAMWTSELSAAQALAFHNAGRRTPAADTIASPKVFARAKYNVTPAVPVTP